MSNDRIFEVTGFHYDSANREKILKDIADVFTHTSEMCMGRMERIKDESQSRETLFVLGYVEYNLRRIQNGADFSDEEIQNFGKLLYVHSRISKIENSIIKKIQKE